MGAGAAIKAGKAFVEFVLSDKKLDSQLSKIGAKLNKFGTIGLAVTGPILAGFAGAASVFASAGSELYDLSKRTGLSVESLSELKFAAEQSGVSLSTVERAARELQKKGIDPKKFDEIAASIAAIPDETARAQAAMEAFGTRSGTALLPMLDELPKLRQQARDLGLTLSTEDADAADRLGDAFDATKAQMTALAVQIGAAIAGPLTNFLVWAQGILAWTIGFIQENPRLVAAIAAITLGIAAASGAAVVFGTILAIISAHPIIAALSLIAGLVLGVATYFGLASDAAGDFKNSLSGVKVPGVGGASPFAGEAAGVQSQLQGALAGRSAASSSPVRSAAAAAAPKLRDFGAEIAKNTRDAAESLQYMVKIISRTPAAALAWF